MTKMDWSDAGDQIKNLVQDAVDSGDFSQLSSTITRVVNGAVDSVEDVLRESLGVGTGSSRSGRGGVFERDRSGREDGFGAAGRGRDGRSGREGSDRNGARGRERISREKVSEAAGEAEVLHGTVDGRGRHEAAERIRRNVEQRRSREYHPVRKKLKAPGLVSGRVMKWTGYSFGGMFGLSLAILAAVGLTTSFSMALPMSILGVLFGGSMLLGHKGSEKVGLATRFRRYTEVLGERTFCLIEELASSVGESSKFVRKDLRRMIRQGFFPQGYLDQKETCLITDKETYRQYLTTQEAYVARELAGEQRGDKEQKRRDKDRKPEQESAESKRDVRATSPGSKLSPECEALLEEGREYIRHIHVCNDRIPDEEISGKLDRMELVVARIFTEAEKDQDIVDDLRKMMSYYLPTTRKLLDAYCELSEQPVQGENIETTKREIEAALDTLNDAFGRLLDSLFEEKAWDISADISVLNTMLAQEGLTKSDFGMDTK